MNGLSCYFVSLNYTVLFGIDVLLEKYSKIFARVHKLNYWECGGDVVVYVQRPKFNLDCVAFFGWCAGLLKPYSTSFTGTQLNCCLTCAVTLPLAICILLSQIHHYTIPLVGKVFFFFCFVSTKAQDSWREIHKPCVTADGGRGESAPVLTHLVKTEWSAKFVWEGFWRCPAALSVQHMLQALASPIAFQVIGQAQREVGFQPHDTSLIHSWIRNKVS